MGSALDGRISGIYPPAGSDAAFPVDEPKHRARPLAARVWSHLARHHHRASRPGKNRERRGEREPKRENGKKKRNTDGMLCRLGAGRNEAATNYDWRPFRQRDR